VDRPALAHPPRDGRRSAGRESESVVGSGGRVAVHRMSGVVVGQPRKRLCDLLWLHQLVVALIPSVGEIPLDFRGQSVIAVCPVVGVGQRKWPVLSTSVCST